MSTELIILIIVVLTALAFDFTNGFHDTANAMATSIATKALKPKTAVSLSAVLNLIGAFLSIEVAKTVGTGIVKLDDSASSSGLMLIVFTGLAGAILWNVFTWLLGLPSSSSHALFGGLIGATLAALGFNGVLWSAVVAKVIIPAVFAPLIAGIVATCGTLSVYFISRKTDDRIKNKGFRYGQVATASLVSLAHGTNDAQKTMGVIFLALVAANEINPEAPIPFWVRAACAVAIALGTYIGGWRIIRTLGKGLVEIDPPQGMAAEGASAAIILTSSHFGMALSTTHVATGSIIGSGLGRRGAQIRFSIMGKMALAWIVTLPAAGAVGALTWIIGSYINQATATAWVGELVVFMILIAFCVGVWAYSQKNKITAANVNDEWSSGKSDKVHTELEHKLTVLPEALSSPKLSERATDH